MSQRSAVSSSRAYRGVNLKSPLPDGTAIIEGLSMDVSADTSAALDEARPRTNLVAPEILGHSRPAPARSRIPRRRESVAHRAQSVALEGIASIEPMPATSRLVAPTSQAMSNQPSTGGSSASSGVVQVSSMDPAAAARAAALLKGHHRYVHGDTRQLDDTALTSAKDGDTILDELLKIEMENSLRNGPTAAASMSPVRTINGTSKRHRRDQSLANTSARTVNLSARRVPKDQLAKPLGRWQVSDWRSLEQCFIDERRRATQKGRRMRNADVIQAYLESRDILAAHCKGEWDLYAGCHCTRGCELMMISRDKLEARVEALVQRRNQKRTESPRRGRSASIASTAVSRAPSDFFAGEDARLLLNARNRDSASFSPSLNPPMRRTAWSAEPLYPTSSTPFSSNYSRFLKPRPPSNASTTGISRAASVGDTLELAPLKVATAFPTNQPAPLYPDLSDLAQSLRPIKQLPIRGSKIMAAVNRLEQLGTDKLPITFGQPQKRKAMSEEPPSTFEAKRQRF